MIETISDSEKVKSTFEMGLIVKGFRPLGIVCSKSLISLLINMKFINYNSQSLVITQGQ